ncbi:TPA: YSIRK-type signal peptide-containing protein [Streptococcus pyogenes]|nr:YSIRK-type signal peptide-containing protein [Streptococcus pyogenes]HES7486614.1 YSIRK-type signal peptide-containing protein [Streptococcus pyogenes]HES7509864.1 YSIRK-type signal peptide-containing protein [Streptococcus pyogenes]
MTRQQTKKNYSLRKLKTGTASVAVALTVLGAGFANQTTVKAESSTVKAESSTISKERELINTLVDENNKLMEERARHLDLIDNIREKDPQYRALRGENQDLREKQGKYQDKIEELEKERKEKQERQERQEKLERQHQDKRYQEQQKKHQQEQQQLEAEKQKLAKEKQISDASRQGLSRDLEASREANKKVTSELTQAKAQLSALEESKKLSEKEKAELQAKLDAQGKALKEQLAKQTEELAKLRAEKAAGSKTPAIKPANKERSGRAAQTATRPSQNKGMRSQLPSTGEAANPFFTAAAATVMVSAGMLALKRKEEN